MQIIDGYCNEPNIFADDIGEYNTAIWGTRDCVLPAGERLGYELVSNNEIKIKDGVFSTQGRRGVIKKGTTESCIIENGTQAENRNDLIVIEYAKDSSTLVESHTLKVIKGTPGEAATDPDVVTGDIQAGDVLHQMPLYRVKLEGLNVVAVERLFSVGNNAIGKEFDPDKDYEIGDLTLQYNKAWKFKVKHLAGAWDESQMKETDVLTELAEQNKNFEALNEKMEDAAKKLVVLWTNPEWNSTTNLTPFVAQEIQIDNISDFDMIGICHSCYDNKRNYFNFFLNIFNKENNLIETFSEVKVTDYYVRLYYRKFIITQSGIKFDIGYSNSHAQVAANNSYAIPVKIIGIKF